MEVILVGSSSPGGRACRAVRRWARRHSLNHPTGRTVWRHSWPWLVVAVMFAAVGCWEGLAFPLTLIAGIGLLGLTRHPRPPARRVQHPRRR